MATDRMALVDVLRKGEDPEADFLQEGVRWLVQELIEAEVSAQVGALRYGEHRSVPEIHRQLTGQGVRITECTVTHLVARYEELVLV